MSIFASRTTKTIAIPFDEPHTITIQKLACRHLQKAHQVSLNEMFQEVAARGGARVQKEISEIFDGDDDQGAEATNPVRANPLAGLDPYTVIGHGLKAWSYDDAPLTPAAIEDLDHRAVEFIATEIVRLTKPELFDDEGARKNA